MQSGRSPHQVVRYRHEEEEEEEPSLKPDEPRQDEAGSAAAGDAGGRDAAASSSGRAGPGGGTPADWLGPLLPALRAAGSALQRHKQVAGGVAAAVGGAAAVLAVVLRGRRRRTAGRHAESANGEGPGTRGKSSAAKKRRVSGASGGSAKRGPLLKLKPTPDCVPLADGSLAVVRRPIAADHSCLFNSVGYCMHQSKSRAPFLRRVVSNEVSGDPEAWNDAFLGMPNAAYCAWINDPVNWGGGIELAILAAHYRREIAAWNIETGEPHVFGEEQGFPRQVMVIYNGVHYDALALTAHPNSSNWEDDVTEFNPRTKKGKMVIEAARKLAQLNNKSFVSATTAAKALKVAAAAAVAAAGGGGPKAQQPKEQLGGLRCTSCAAEVDGQAAAALHAQQTGHQTFEQV